MATSWEKGSCSVHETKRYQHTHVELESQGSPREVLVLSLQRNPEDTSKRTEKQNGWTCQPEWGQADKKQTLPSFLPSFMFFQVGCHPEVQLRRANQDTPSQVCPAAWVLVNLRCHQVDNLEYLITSPNLVNLTHSSHSLIIIPLLLFQMETIARS
jgi:hypothetical protein